jgi:pentatricopeptide repeat protein
VENSDIILDTPFSNCVVRAYGWAGDVDKMSNLFLEMKGRKCKPDSITSATMIQAYNAQGMENMMIATRRN